MEQDGPNTKRDIATSLRRAARAQADKQNFSFSKDSRRFLYDFIKTGVDNIASQGQLQDNKLISDAENTIERFVDEMIKAAKEYGTDYLTEKSFGAARATICPVWPFC